MSEPMTLEALLELVERYQALMDRVDPKREYDGQSCEEEVALRDVDLVALRAVAQQHAAQLREEAEDGDAGEGVSSTVLRAAAEFLQPSGAQEQA